MGNRVQEYGLAARYDVSDEVLRSSSTLPPVASEVSSKQLGASATIQCTLTVTQLLKVNPNSRSKSTTVNAIRTFLTLAPSVSGRLLLRSSDCPCFGILDHTPELRFGAVEVYHCLNVGKVP